MNNNEFETFFAFANCKDENEYVEKFLGSNIDEASYQLTYDMSNDWIRDNPTWDDVQKAFLVGTKYSRAKDGIDTKIIDYRENEIKELKSRVNFLIRDSIEKETQLKDELDALHMRYISQVGLYKSLYEEEKKKNNKYNFLI